MAPQATMGSKLRNFDWFRKVPRDLSEATLPGSIISLCAMFLMVCLFFLELRAFLTTVTKTQVMIDRSSDGAWLALRGMSRLLSRRSGDSLRINFNVSFPHLQCQYASVDVSDVLGMARYNLTKTVRKRPIDGAGSVVGEWYVDRAVDIKHEDEDSPALLKTERMDEEGRVVASDVGAEGAVELTKEGMAEAQRRYPLLLVNFYAPWCPWSQRMAPVWEATARQLHQLYSPAQDGRLLLAKVDCTRAMDLCREAQVQGFPSVRVYRGGSDLVDNPAALGRASQEHAQYVGDRTVEALTAFAEGLLPAARTQHQHLALPASDAQTAAAAARFMARTAHPGCAIDGFVLVKKVPGALYVSAQSASHSFVPGAMNVSHVVHELSVGARPPPRKMAELARLMPGGLPPSWADKLAGSSFASPSENTTHEHFLQIVRTIVQPLRTAPGAAIDAYEYTVHSHAFATPDGGPLPHAKFSFAPSPMLVHIQEETRYGAYHFITTVSALIGGVFTVASIADAGAQTVAKLVKKNELGKLY